MARSAKIAAPFFLIASLSSPAFADEGASGLYVPGNFGFGAGVTPGPGIYLSASAGYYDGDIKVYIDGGKIVYDVVARPVSTSYATLWVPEAKILGGQLGLSLRTSYNHAWVDGRVTGLIEEDKTVSGWGLGDTVPRAQLGWTNGPWSNTLYLTGWLPTGRYQRGFRPNTGKNRYGVNLGWGVSYIEPKTLLEFDSAIGVTWSSRNPATHYQNGEAFSWEWAVGKGWHNGLKVGVAGYAYQQLTGDSGSGAKLGAFKGRVFGVGPQVVYNTILLRQPVIFNLHNYQEFGAINRFEGNVTTFGATFRF